MTLIIANSRPWHKELAKDLSEKSGEDFFLIRDPLELTLEKIKAINPRYLFFPHWSHMISEEIYTAFDCVIFHMTDLPFGRGGSPMQNLISRGIYETKISALKAVKDVDAGPLYLKKEFSLGEGTAAELFAKMTPLIESMILEIVEKRIEPKAQEGEPVHFKRRKPSESDCSSLETLQQFYDHIRMLDAEGYPSAFIDIGGFRLEFKGASLNCDKDSLEATVSIQKSEEVKEAKDNLKEKVEL